MAEKKFDVVIESKFNPLDFHFKELLRYRDLIFLFVRRNFVAQYKQTVLGPVWAIIQPLLTTIVFSVIFGNVAGLGADGVPTFIFYLSGTVMWSYFGSCLTNTSNTFISNSSILGKVYFPRLVMPISTVFSNLIGFGIQFGMFLCFIIYYLFTDSRVQVNWGVCMFPLYVIQLAMLALGFGVIISSLTTKYRDLAMLVGFIAEMWKYLTPIAYDMFKLHALAPGGKLHALYMLNPVTPIINGFRYGFLGIGQIEWFYYGIGWATTIVIFFIGVFLFNRVERTFMDTI